MINARSPYFIIKQVANLTQMDVDISTYTGTLSTDEPAAQYSLTTTAITPATGNPYAVIDISDIVRDYIESTFDGTYVSTCVWVAYQITTYINDVSQTPEAIVRMEVFDGYQYFEEGEQSNVSTYTAPAILQTNRTIYKPLSEVVRIPLYQEDVTDVYFRYNNANVDTDLISSTNESTDIIRYPESNTNEIDEINVRVGGFILPDSVIEVVNIDTCKHTPYKLIFSNKFGALQDLWFFGKSNLSISTTKEEYKSNILSIGSYDTSRHQKRVLTKNGSESLSINSGWYPESFNEVFRQLHLSESVWIDYEGEIIPVNVSDGGMEFKKSVNDKLINNSITIEFAFDKINNIR